MSDQQLMNTMQEIGGLLFRKLNDDLNETERITLENWLDQRDPADREFFEQMLDRERIQSAMQILYEFDEESALRDIQKKILAANETVSPAAVISMEQPSRSHRKYYLTAAVALTLIAGIYIVYTFNKGKTNIDSLPVAQRFKNDVLPGGNKALLQLTDGSTIVLDSAGKGELTNQGVAKVIKLDEGKLTYETAGHKLSSASPTVYNTLTTPRGGQFEVQLPDGSKVWLNAASSLKFPTTFTGKERKVELSGEAYFQIARNPAMSFKVSIAGSAGPLEIEVIGTEFNIMSYPEEKDKKTTVIDGAVKVNASNREVVLKPGQQAQVTGNFINVLSDVNTEEVTAWKNGLFQFQDASIQSIMQQVTRWYDVDVVYQGEVKQQFIGKIPRHVPVSTLLKILESTGWVHFMIEGKKITVAP